MSRKQYKEVYIIRVAPDTEWLEELGEELVTIVGLTPVANTAISLNPDKEVKSITEVEEFQEYCVPRETYALKFKNSSKSDVKAFLILKENK